MNAKRRQISSSGPLSESGLRSLALFAAVVLLGGCRAIGALFKTGVWTGIILVVVLLAVVGGALSLFRKV